MNSSEEARSSGSVVKAGKKHRAPTLYAIIALKLLKGVALLLISFGVYKLAGADLQERFTDLLKTINVDPEKKFFGEIGRWLDTITAANVRWVATGTFLYSLFSLIEGAGLIFRVSWAGWMAIGESAFFVPIELYELLRQYSTSVAVILALNILIVVYLFQNRKRLFTH